MCGRDADEPKHRWSSDTPRNLACSVSRHEYLLDEYKNGPLAVPLRLLKPERPPPAHQPRRSQPAAARAPGGPDRYPYKTSQRPNPPDERQSTRDAISRKGG